MDALQLADALQLVEAATTANIPVTDVVGQQVVQFPQTKQEWSAAVITIHRSGVGGTHPWLNSLASTDTLTVQFSYSTDGGTTWHPQAPDTFTGGSHVVKGQTVPVANDVGLGIGTPFPVGTLFTVTLTASTPLTFDGIAEYQ